VECLESDVEEKERLLKTTQSKLTAMVADQSSSGTALSALEDSLRDKQQQIERCAQLCKRSHTMIIIKRVCSS
jgi:hypothetical protein